MSGTVQQKTIEAYRRFLTHGNISLAAREVGVARRTVQRYRDGVEEGKYPVDLEMLKRITRSE
jgi:hypothetical protein